MFIRYFHPDSLQVCLDPTCPKSSSSPSLQKSVLILWIPYFNEPSTIHLIFYVYVIPDSRLLQTPTCNESPLDSTPCVSPPLPLDCGISTSHFSPAWWDSLLRSISSVLASPLVCFPHCSQKCLSDRQIWLFIHFSTNTSWAPPLCPLCQKLGQGFKTQSLPSGNL